ncbi:hypothetical protein FRB95_011607 [Tulasnella sp. JGI-2019a]|nr:hypothetical protein FRB95_011607 [Tulasnella sp. JGI-2019a]
MRQFHTKPQDSLDENPVLISRVGELKGVLEKIKREMQALMSRRLLKRVFTYASDSSRLAAMKKRVDEATHRLQASYRWFGFSNAPNNIPLGLFQLETVMATGRHVDLHQQMTESCVETLLAK